jgi:SAM-dependent methyltransferase
MTTVTTDITGTPSLAGTPQPAADNSARADWRPGAPVTPAVKIRPQPFEGRIRLVARWTRFMFRSLRSGDFDYSRNAARAQARMLLLTLGEALPSREHVECNICGWRGRRFYPNSGPGYDEVDMLCPGCRGLDRHRALLAILLAATDYFAPGTRVIEVAPMRRFQALCLAQGTMDYTSFDLERYAMERGDITEMRFAENSADYFTCFHVLEHIPAEAKALAEIRRVLKPGGIAILQVPVDRSVGTTYEYDKPDPREVGHVRRYGRDFGQRIASHGFDVTQVSVRDWIPHETIRRFGLSIDPVFLARKPM